MTADKKPAPPTVPLPASHGAPPETRDGRPGPTIDEAGQAVLVRVVAILEACRQGRPGVAQLLDAFLDEAAAFDGAVMGEVR